MAYSELVKNFSHVREYMKEFYVYGFKSRDEFNKKSGRAYDDERRRIESWLGDYMQFRQTAGGKNVFLSIDSRISRHNPLYKAWKAKSFEQFKANIEGKNPPSFAESLKNHGYFLTSGLHFLQSDQARHRSLVAYLL